MARFELDIVNLPGETHQSTFRPSKMRLERTKKKKNQSKYNRAPSGAWALISFPFQVCTRNWETCKRPSLEPVFGLSILGYCSCMTVQHGSLCGRGPSVDIIHSCSGNKKQRFLFSGDYTLMKTSL